MLTCGTVVIFGALGLVVDIGYAYFRQQAQRTAVEAAALAAAEVAAAATSPGNTFSCTNARSSCQTTTACASQVANPPNTNMDNGCLFAQSNGYTTGGNNGRQKVQMAAGVGSPPGMTGITTNYWVTATATDSLPQLFSAVVASGPMHTGAFATAAVVAGKLGLCIYALDPTANNAFVESGGQTSVQANCGVYVDSSRRLKGPSSF